ncbi:type III-B CRISPR module RAMP protein Cmr1 [Thermogemmatispora carboxidivorans]|uniref:type III-B CRISPR module RAMP protein Cmr1 n=1 Tax=Thermogemmatispora carboxidivorans TaxID=1382306 RepID=UPI0006993153|nr:type III-B CRISPR module RAMP protein Cmr1 [Thermogemmatispora carboxidivorans]
MLKATFEIEVTTPLFLAGANQAEAELRPPSLRGAMRYWYRALIGGTTGGNLDKVRRREAQVFGETEYGSPIRVLISHGDTLKIKGSAESFKLHQLKKGKKDLSQVLALVSGEEYLLWPALISGKRSYYDVGSRFSCHLSIANRAHGQDHPSNEDLLLEAIASLWLLTNLGGLGARSRRCAGSLLITNFDLGQSGLLPGDLTKAFERASSISDLQDKITLGINSFKKILSNSDNDRKAAFSNTRFDIIHPSKCSIYIISHKKDSWISHKDALEHIGNTLRGYYHRPEQSRKEAFSHPLATVRKGRKTSPLHLHITALEKEYVCVATLFHHNQVKNYSHDVILKFLEHFKLTPIAFS